MGDALRPPAADRDFHNDGLATNLEGVAPGGDYVGNAGPFAQYGFFEHETDASRGVLFTFSRIKPGKVTDGTSNTLAIGEKYIPPGNDHNEQGDTSIISGDNPWTIFRATALGFPVGPSDLSQEKFGSEHTNLAHFVFLDGHVVLLNYSIAVSVFNNLGVIADGFVVSDNEY